MAKQEHKIKNINNDLEEKVSLTDYRELRDRIARWEFEKKEVKKLELQRESYSKRLNPLIHGLDEVGPSVWETKTQTLDIFDKFMTDGLGLDPKPISLVDIYRLPRRHIVEQGSNITRPIIIKLATAMDKHTRDGNSAAYAAARCFWCTAPRSVATKIYITSQRQHSAAYNNFFTFFLQLLLVIFSL